MAPPRIIEGTGQELELVVHQFPSERFQLISMPNSSPALEGGPSETDRREISEFIRSLKGKMGSLPLGQTSTEALYD